MNGIRRHLFWIYVRKTIYALILGFIGSILGAYFQNQNWREQNELSKLETDRKKAEEIFSELSTLMGDRQYKTIKLLSSYKQGDSLKIRANRESLCLQLEIWGAQKDRLHALVDGYFGKECSDYFMRNIQPRFALSGNLILSKPVDNINRIENILAQIGAHIFILNKKMINAIKEDKIGRFISKSRE